jgi:hypothetical protein
MLIRLGDIELATAQRRRFGSAMAVLGGTARGR